MKATINTLAAAAAVVFLAGCAGSPQADDGASGSRAKLEKALAGRHRSAANVARDEWRNPIETLEFFEVEPTSTVMEIWPGGGWYTEVLAPYLRDSGTYIAAGWDPNSEMKFIRNAAARYQEKLDASPDVYDQVEMAILMPPNMLEPVEPGSVDVVLTFRNVHNWMPRGQETMMMKALYDALKPGGTLGIVEHRGNPAVEQDPKAKSGYVNESFTIALAEAAGFQLAAKSEINANPADTKDHPEGVWTLPPTLRLKDQDREKYVAIGESDRFTLKFVKPEA